MASGSEAQSSATGLSRLPTTSASQALLEASAAASNPILLGLDSLDSSLQGPASSVHGAPRGLPPGRVTEIYGPPGVGKTALCLQASAGCLRSGAGVIWIDAGSQVVPARLRSMLGANRHGIESAHENAEATMSNLPTKFTHYQVPTLAHFLALLISLQDHLPQEEATRLIVVDSLATVLEMAYPRSADQHRKTARNDRSLSTAGRRQAVISQTASKLSSLAASRNVTILVTNGVVTRVVGGVTAFLKPAIFGHDWDDVVWSRIVLFRDWAQSDDQSTSRCNRFARILKSQGQSWQMSRVLDSTVAFDIQAEKLSEVATVRVSLSNHRHGRKRSFEQVEDSDNDNSDGDYGWAVDDAELAAEGLVDDVHLSKQEFTSASMSKNDQRPGT